MLTQRIKQKLVMIGVTGIMSLVVSTPSYAGGHGGCIGTLVLKRTLIELQNPFHVGSEGFFLDGSFDMVVSSEPTTWNLEQNNNYANYNWLSSHEGGLPSEETFLVLDGAFYYTQEDGTKVKLDADFSLEKEIVYSDHPPDLVQSGGVIRPIDEIQPFVESEWNASWFPALQTHQIYFKVMINDLQLLDQRFPESVELVNRTPLIMQGNVSSWNFDPNRDERKEGPVMGTQYSLLESVELFQVNDSFNPMMALGTVVTSSIVIIGHYSAIPEPSSILGLFAIGGLGLTRFRQKHQ